MDAIAAILWHSIFQFMNTTTEEKLGLTPIQLGSLERKWGNKVRTSTENLIFSVVFKKAALFFIFSMYKC